MTVLTLLFADLSALALYRNRSCPVITVLLFVLAITINHLWHVGVMPYTAEFTIVR